MKSMAIRFMDTYFGPALDLRVRLFNTLAAAGVLISLISAVSTGINGEGALTVAACLLLSAVGTALLFFAARTGRYQLCYTLTIVIVFFLIFPFTFFIGGGYDSAMPYYFVFAILFTIFMLNEKRALILAAVLLVFYVGLFIFAMRIPGMVRPLSTMRAEMMDKIVGFVIVSIALSLTMYAQTNLYREQQRKLDEQNAVLSQANRAKTEFLANVSHEMRTPLTVISVNIQTAMGIINRMDEAMKDPEAVRLLTEAQSEIMRLSRMAGGMLALSSVSDSVGKSKTNLTKLLDCTADMLGLLLSKRGNKLDTNISEGLTVFGDADLLVQVVVNLIQNSHDHTHDDVIRLHCARSGSTITVTVKDNGTGIVPELLPHVFERGVSGKGIDGCSTGYGLFLCKTVVESHGGGIWIESEPGKGTAAFFTLPVYEGQFGGDTV